MANYTKLTIDDIKQIADAYDIGCIETASPMEGGQANSSYSLSTGKGRFILSVCDQKNVQEIECLTQMLSYLETEKFPTSRLIRTRRGEGFIMMENKPVYLKSYIEGEIVRWLTPSKLVQIGEVLANLHQVPPIDLVPGHFPYGIAFFDEILNRDDQHPYLGWLKEKKAFFEDSLDPEMDKGLIHGDLFWDNLLFSGETLVAVLDFEEVCHYYRLFDLGMCAVGCCGRDGLFDMKKIKPLLHGYQRYSKLGPHKKKQLKIFMEYAAASMSSWRFHQYNIKYPGHELAHSYQELSSMADNIHEISNSEFMAAL